jgi:type II secretory pathway pseudopilin PulG
MSMTKLKAGIISIVVAGLGSSLVIQHQAQVKLREENLSLRQQVEQLAQMVAENERLPNRIDQGRSALALSNDQRNELMRLRRQVGELRNHQPAHYTSRATVGSQGTSTAEAASEAVSSQTIPRES